MRLGAWLALGLLLIGLSGCAGLRPPPPVYGAGLATAATAPVELVDVNMAAGAHKAPTFLQLNPFGQVPVIQDGNLTLSDSNAILVYLTQRYAPDADA